MEAKKRPAESRSFVSDYGTGGTSQILYPWRRFFARMLDLSIYGIIWLGIFVLVFHANLTRRSSLGNNVLDIVASTLLMLFIEPLLLNMFKKTPGKAIFGIQIENPDGSRLSYSEGLTRTWGVISTGMGYGIPIYNFICMWREYKNCMEREIQPWDDGICYRVKDTKWYRVIMYIAADMFCFGLLVLIFMAQVIPPNRGRLTIAEYAENYNYYLKYMGFHSEYASLSPLGTWQEEGSFETVSAERPKPRFEYSLEDGYVTGISFLAEENGTESRINTCEVQMVAASLSYAGAQRENGIFSKFPMQIVTEIAGHGTDRFDFTDAGIRFRGQTECLGFEKASFGRLIPVEGASRYYFRQEFSMDLTEAQRE